MSELRHRHLNDDQLMELYVLAGTNPHLAACAECHGRLDELAGALEQMRHEALCEADAAFSPDRLHDQRERILRRIERHDHPAEVVRFPSPSSVRPGVQRVLGPARRWVAGAAAAGLAAGMFLGFAMDRRTHDAAISDAIHEASVRTAAWQAPAEPSHDQFLFEIEEAIVGSRPREMRADLDAIDVMTTPLEIREASYLR